MTDVIIQKSFQDFQKFFESNFPGEESSRAKKDRKLCNSIHNAERKADDRKERDE